MALSKAELKKAADALLMAAEKAKPIAPLSDIDSQLSGELGTVGPPCSDFQAFAQVRAIAGAEIMHHALYVRAAKTLGNDQFGQGLAHDLLLAIAKTGFRSGIELDDIAFAVHADNAIQRRFHGGAQAVFAFGQGLFTLLAFGNIAGNGQYPFSAAYGGAF